MDEYKFDGFRFDGVTSMMYTHRGLEVSSFWLVIRDGENTKNFDILHLSNRKIPKISILIQIYIMTENSGGKFIILTKLKPKDCCAITEPENLFAFQFSFWQKFSLQFD